ncbi:MAG: precorrin-3B C(17)-methyltransferase, partial [Pseudomonadota bacterium]
HGANDLARRIASAIDGFAAGTTAGDLKFGVALDAPPAGYVLANQHAAKDVMAKLLSGSSARLDGQAEWLSGSDIPFSPEGEVSLRITDQQFAPEADELVYHPASLVLGMGCERGADPREAIDLAERVIAESGFASRSIACVASIDLKADEPAIQKVAEHFGVPVRFFTATELELQAARLRNPSEVVFAETGCHGVAEGAALAMVDEDGCLAVEKQKSKRVTAAIARRVTPITELAGRPRGTLFVVGIGPGKSTWRSPEVSAMIEASTDLVGYSLYLDLIEDIGAGKIRHDFDLGAEELRVRHAMELAGEGRTVSLICSGDAGIYAMATLVFELLEKGGLSEAAQKIAIEVSPGISALQAAASLVGAPLGHDFCTISLSDLLTPWPDIKRRVTAAAEGDFVIAFYNPVSRRRRTQLAEAKQILLAHRPSDTPVILATNLGRKGEAVRVVPLEDLQVEDLDMLTVVLVGSSQTCVVKTGHGKDWVYTPRGYAAKEGTGIIQDGASPEEAAQ